MAEKEKPQVNPEKLKVLSAVMDKIEKDFGKGAIMKMSDRAVDKVPVIPSGSVTIDHALGIGGYPKGRIIEIFPNRRVKPRWLSTRSPRPRKRAESPHLSTRNMLSTARMRRSSAWISTTC